MKCSEELAQSRYFITESEVKEMEVKETGKCCLCGGDDCAGVALSRLRLLCGYGSRYDGERIELDICGDCADRILDTIQNINEG